MAIKGDNIIVSVYDGTAYRPTACITSNSLSTTLEVLESNNKCNPGVTSKDAGAFSASVDLDGEYIDTTSIGGDTAKASHDFLLIKQLAKEKITFRISTGLADTSNYYGVALITDLSQDAPSNENATFSATFDVDGNLLTTDPIA